MVRFSYQEQPLSAIGGPTGPTGPTAGKSGELVKGQKAKEGGS